MKGTTVLTASRWVVTALALMTVLALVVGVRPRALAEETGRAPLTSGVCFLCDGSFTAAAAAPSADHVLPVSVVLNITLILALTPLRMVVEAPYALSTARPPSPPPRA
jgi:hypothetical protein